jgi:microcystin-dependent protein/cytoskeletal protein CcmA (bactofilin family)
LINTRWGTNMPIPGQENINIGAENEAENSDSLFIAFNKTQNNFSTLFAQSSQYTSFVGSDGISTTLNSNNKQVIINNTGVTRIAAGTGIAVNSANGNVVISVIGLSNGNLVAGVTNVGITSSTLQIINSPVVSSGTIGVDLPVIANIIPGTYSNPLIQVDNYGRITSVQNTFSTGTVTSVDIQNGSGISVSGGPITSNGTITVTNTGVRRLNPGPGILLTDTTGEITISANFSTFTGTVSRVTVVSNTLTVSNPTVTLAGNIRVELPINISVAGNVTGGGNFNVGQSVFVDGNVTANGRITAGNISASGNILSNGNISINSASRLRIPGGTNGQVLQTDGAGNLSFVTVTQNTAAGLGAPGANTQILFNDGGIVNANANLTFNKATGTLTAPNFSGNINVNTANFVSNAIQANITTLGNLTSLSVIGNIIGNNNLNINGNITSNSFIYALTPAANTSNNQVATTAFVANYVGNAQFTSNLYAPINSPIFTGTPQAPTLDQTLPGSNALATTAFVKSALGNANISGYAPINSPAFTGIPTAPNPSANTSSNQIATTSFVQSLLANANIGGSGTTEYAGTIQLWAATTPMPDNTWMVCDGTEVSRTTYATLFSRIGTTYGAGNGTTTFNLPNFTNRFPVGAGNLYALGSTGGSKDAVVVSHTHSVTDPGHPHILRIGQSAGTLTPQIGGWNFAGTFNATAYSNHVQSANTNISIDSTGEPGTNKNLPPYLGLIYIIKVTDTVGSGGSSGGGNVIVTGSTTATAEIYQWNATQPAIPSVTSTYTWATSLFSPVPSGWSTTPGTTVTPGATLWVIRVTVTKTGSETTTTFTWSGGTISASGYNGTNGVDATKTATISLYQWSTTQPANPSGNSTYTWSTTVNTGYTGGAGWQVSVPVNPGTAGLQLWSASKGITAASSVTSSTVDWSSGFTVRAVSINGEGGPGGTQYATPEVYQWAITIPAGPTGTSVYTWSSGSFTPVPSGWSTSGGAAPSPGFTLYAATVRLADSTTVSTSNINWTTATIGAIGYAGQNGSPGTAAKVVTLTSNGESITFDGSGNADPASQTITFTALLENITGNATFTCEAFNSTNTSLGNITLGGTVPSNIRTLTNTQFVTYPNTAYVRVTATADSRSDIITINRIQDGADSITGYLTNESVTLSASSDGTVTNFAPANGEFRVFAGLLNVTTSATFSVVSSTGCTVAINTSGAITVSAMTSDTATANLRAVYNSITIDKVLSLSKSLAGAGGGPGVNGTRTAILDMYRVGTATPTIFPSGTSTYTWATGQFTAPATLNGWSLTPPAPSAGQTLYIVRQVYADNNTTLTSSVTWSAASALISTVSGINGLPGTNGTRTAVLEVYLWAASTPTNFPSGTSTYTWATGAFTAPTTPNGWSLLPGSSTPGFNLYACSVTFADTNTTATSSVTWNTATAYVVGYAGTNGSSSPGAEGASARICYTKTTLSSLASTPTTITTTGNSSFPPASSWGTGTSWQGTPPALSAGESLYQSDGIYSPSTGNTVWNVPYLSSLKVGSLSAITVNTGALSVTDILTVGTTGKIQGGQTDYNTGTGFFLGYSGGAYKFSIGNTSQGLTWSGSGLSIGGGTLTSTAISGVSIDGSTFTGGTIRTSATNPRVEMSAASNDFRVYNSSGTVSVRMGGTNNFGATLSALGTASQGPTITGTNDGAPGVRGNATGLGEGVYGSSVNGYGVLGESSSSEAVRGVATVKGGGNHGVRGLNTNGYAAGQNSAGLVGAANGYNFYADGASPLDYGTFTGVHDALSELADTFTIGDIVIDIEIIVHSSVSSTISLVKTSTTPNQRAALGVVSMEPRPLSDFAPKAYIQGWGEDPITKKYGQIILPCYKDHSKIYNLLAVNALGEGQINVCGENGDIEAGDLIVTSSIPGKGMKQADDIVRSYTVARSREAVTFSSPTEVKMIACIFLSG